MTLLKWFAAGAFLVVGGFVALYLFAQTADGPIGPFPGGPFTSGEIVATPINDWSFAATAGEIELQLTADASSRTTWLAVVGARAYIPAATGFPPNKSWYLRAQDNGAAQIRIDGQRYPVHLRRILTKDDEFNSVVAQLESAEAMPPGGPDGLWLFRVFSR